MDSKRKVSQVFNNNRKGSRLRRRPKKNRRWNYAQAVINKDKIKNWKERSKTSWLGEVHYGGEGPLWTV